MREQRPAGCLYGMALRRLEVAGFILTETTNVRTHLPAHAHENSYFCYLLQGAYTEQYCRQTITCKPSSLTFRPAGEAHEDWVHLESRVFVLEIPQRWVERLREDSLTLERPTSYRNASLRWLSEKLYREFHRRDTASRLAIEGLVLEMLAEASRQCTEPKGHVIPRWLHRAREILADRFSDNLTLTEVAAEVGVHQVHLAASFRKHYGCSVGEFVRRLKIERASQELSKGQLSLAAISSTTGFADQSHFTRTFKRYKGMTPTEYKRELRNS